MMITEVVLWSSSVAQKVVNDLITVWRDGKDTFCEVPTFSYDEGRNKIPQETLLLRPLDIAATVSDGTELVPCVTQDGRKVTVFPGSPSLRDIQSALIVPGQLPM